MFKSPDTSFDGEQEKEKDDQEVDLTVVIGIPAYNSERLLGRTVTALKGVVDQIIVCDNGSTDQTRKIAEDLGCKIVALPRHSDDSAALRSIFGAALETRVDLLITLVPGTVINSSDIENLAEAVVMEHSDIVVGTNQAIGGSDMEDSPIKAYAAKAISKLFSSNSTKLGTAMGLGLHISKCEVSYMPKAAVKIQNKTVEVPSGRQQNVVLERNPSNRIRPVAKTPRSMSRFMFRNIWFWRYFILILGMIASVLLLVYSLIFLNTFLLYQNTTSYFPWAWRILYTSSGTVMNFFYIGMATSLIPLIVCSILFGKWVLPEMQISSAVFRRRKALSESSD